MSAAGIQLSSAPSLTYFQPTVRQYLQSIRDAVAFNHLSAAQQAFAQLAKVIPVSAQVAEGQTGELAGRINQGMQALGQALETGDLTAAQHAVAGIRTNVQSMSKQAPPQPDGATSESGSNLNVRA
jgi:hypothetical protein